MFAKCKALGFIPECLCISASSAESVHLVDVGVRPGITIVAKRYAEELVMTKATLIQAPGSMVYVGLCTRNHTIITNHLEEGAITRL
jgi:hypothetical protein